MKASLFHAFECRTVSVDSLPKGNIVTKPKRPIADLNGLAMLADWQLRGQGINPTTLTKECLRRDAELVEFRAAVRAGDDQQPSLAPGM